MDNDAQRMAVSRGSSAKLGHLRVHADTRFHFLAQLPISLHRADIMTKVLSAVGHQELCKTDFDLDAVPAASFMTHAVLSPHASWQSRGSQTRVFSCSCATATEQTDLCVEVRKMFLLTKGLENVFLSSSPVVRNGGAREI